MTAAASGRAVSPTELLDVRERQWRERLAVVSLAAEALGRIKKAHRVQTLTALGHLYARQVTTAKRSALLERWPAVHVLTTAGVAVDHWDGGFWPRLASLIGATVEDGLSQEWGNAFLNNLRRLDLPTFDSGNEDAGTRYVGRILMHSGMPTYCLRDYFRLIGERRSRVDGLDPGELVSWAAARAARRDSTNAARSSL